MNKLLLSLSVGNSIKSWLIALGISIASVLAPIKPLLLTVGFLIVVDFVFGIVKSIKNSGWESITSRKMGNSVAKLLLYNLAIISVYVLETYILNTGLPLAKMASGLIALVEIKSLDESIKVLFGFSIWSKMSKMIRRGESTTKI